MIKIFTFQKILYCLVTLCAFGGWNLQHANAAEPTILYMFWGEGCHHCEKEKTFLVEDLQQRYPDLEMRFFETWEHHEFKRLAQTMRQVYKIEKSSVPLTIVGEWTVIGFGSPETTGAKIEEQIKTCLQEGCIDALDKIGPQRIALKIKNEAAKNEPVEWELYPVSATKDE